MTKLYKTTFYNLSDKTFTPLRKRIIIKNWGKSKIKSVQLYMYETFPNLLEKTAIIINSYKS